jgi:hypothetical protein
MDGITVSEAAQAAIDTLPRGEDGKPVEKPEIRSDNGSGYTSKEFKVVLKEHHRIKPHWIDRMDAPNAAGAIGWEALTNQPPGSGKGLRRGGALLQRRTVT